VKIQLLCVGRLKEAAEQAIVERYLERFGQLARPLGFGAVVVTELSESRAGAADARKAAEASDLRKRLPAEARIMALDERGALLGSEDFADQLRRWRDGGVRNCCIVIGGPDGLDPSITGDAALVFSLGRITLPHGLARAVVAEQLYRAATILARHPYHRA
jgi:23S rRNA (pseudouridine1915-N3)-methyltransferase